MKLFLTLTIISLLTACAGLNTPKHSPTPKKTLIVGKIIFNGSKIKGNTVNLNGEHSKDLKLSLKNIDGDDFTILSGSGGLFYLWADTNKPFSINQLGFKKTSGSAWSSTNTRTNIYFETASTGVTNIGTINWKKIDNRSKTSRSTDNNNSVKKLFSNTFKDNEWTTEKWNDI